MQEQSVHEDLAGPITNESIDHYDCLQSFTGVYSDYMFIFRR